jgi:hypothetical protein
MLHLYLAYLVALRVAIGPAPAQIVGAFSGLTMWMK